MTWNSEIKPGESVSIQFQGKDTKQNSKIKNMVFSADGFETSIGDSKVENPSEEETSEEEESESSSASEEESEEAPSGDVSFKKVVTSEWNTGYNVELEITNNTDSTLKNWYITFDWVSEIADVYTGELSKTGDNSYKIGCASWNSEIKAGETVTIYLQGKDTKCNEKMKNVTFTADNFSCDL